MADALALEERLAALECRAAAQDCRLAALERALAAMRSAALLVVDAVERENGCTPRTAELRKVARASGRARDIDRP